MFRMIPDAENSSPATPDYIRSLIQKTGRPATWCAARVGITDRYLRELTSGNRQASYSLQFTLESLAHEMEQLRLAAQQHAHMKK
ncbi:hypothetical protein [Alcaligenes sp. SDU_A2]|uniref:hypothetical protein n=1 Tax=Alcaligenes sp. SDU_A2 TaxID=3136634 RepID=UPI00311F9147